MPERAEAGDRALRITAIMAVHNEADIIAQTVGELVRQRIAVHVLDHRSSDDTVAALAPLVRSGLVHVEPMSVRTSPEDAVERFAWADILARKEQLARELDADWFIHHDADEFRESPWRHLNLREGIELVDRLGYNAIDFAVLNFWPTHDAFDATIDIRGAFRHYELGEAFNRVQVKCWKKTPDIDLASSGGHDVQFPSRKVFPLRFLLRHYPIRSQAHGHRKVFEERKPRFTDEERERGWHVQYDSLDAEHQFLRDPTTLRLYDPDAVRVDLQIHHRQVEELTDQLAASAAEARATLEALDDERTSRAAEVLSLTLEAKALTQDRDLLSRHIETLERHVVELEHSWSWRLTEPARRIARLLGMGRPLA